MRGLRIRGYELDVIRSEGGIEFMRELRMDTLHVMGGANEVTLVQRFLTELSGLEHLKVLYLDGVRSDDVAALNELGRLTQVRKFGLRLSEPIVGAFSSTIFNQSISRMTELETFRLHGVEPWIDFETIASLKNLAELDVSQMDLSANELFAISRLEKLKKLKLSDSRITGLTGSRLSTQGKFSTLTHLSLARSEVSPVALLALVGAPTLTHVDLSEVSSEVRWAKVWKKLSAASQLRQLNLLQSLKVSKIKGLEEVKSLVRLVAGIESPTLILTPEEQKQVLTLRNRLPLLQEFLVPGSGASFSPPFQDFSSMFSKNWGVGGFPDERSLWSGEVSAEIPIFRREARVLGHTHSPAEVPILLGHTHR